VFRILWAETSMERVSGHIPSGVVRWQYLTESAQSLTAPEYKGPNARRVRPNRVLGGLARPDRFGRLIPGIWAGRPRWEEEGRVTLA
jgi:hypothetical protein